MFLHVWPGLATPDERWLWWSPNSISPGRNLRDNINWDLPCSLKSAGLTWGLPWSTSFAAFLSSNKRFEDVLGLESFIWLHCGVAKITSVLLEHWPWPWCPNTGILPNWQQEIIPPCKAINLCLSQLPWRHSICMFVACETMSSVLQWMMQCFWVSWAFWCILHVPVDGRKDFGLGPGLETNCWRSSGSSCLQRKEVRPS